MEYDHLGWDLRGTEKNRGTLTLLPHQKLGSLKLGLAQVAGIQAAKATASLIPLCHPLALDTIDIHFEFTMSGMKIYAEAKTAAKTGVEMEVLTAVSVAALAIYDMCKAVDSKIMIGPIQLLSKFKEEPHSF